MSKDLNDVAEFFNLNAANYEALPGGATASVARLLLPLLPTPLTSTSIIHDNAAGTGLDILEISKVTPPIHPTVYATDLSPTMISIVSARSFPHTAVRASVTDSADLSQFASDMFTHSITNFGLFFVPNYNAALREIIRTTQPGGVIAITSWENIGFVPFAIHAMKSIRPHDDEFKPLWDKGFSDPVWMKNLLTNAGLKDVEVYRRDVYNYQKTREGFAESLKKLMNTYISLWSLEEQAQWEPAMLKAFDELPGMTANEETGGWKLPMQALICIAKK